MTRLHVEFSAGVTLFLQRARKLQVYNYAPVTTSLRPVCTKPGLHFVQKQVTFADDKANELPPFCGGTSLQTNLMLSAKFCRRRETQSRGGAWEDGKQTGFTAWQVARPAPARAMRLINQNR
jgi:hypothetical protein